MGKAYLKRICRFDPGLTLRSQVDGVRVGVWIEIEVEERKIFEKYIVYCCITGNAPHRCRPNAVRTPSEI